MGLGGAVYRRTTLATPRTTSDAVKATLGADNDLDDQPDLQRYLITAALIVNRVVTCAARKAFTHTAQELEVIESWLAAHLYTKSDPTYSSRSTAGASGQFIRDPVTPEPYKDGAIMADVSGCLNAILNRKTAGGFWLGKPPSAQIDYEDRD